MSAAPAAEERVVPEIRKGEEVQTQKGNWSNINLNIDMAEDVQRKLLESKELLQHKSSSLINHHLPNALSTFSTYENAFFRGIKHELMAAREHPSAAIAVAVTSALLLLRGPRRFLFRHTLGRFQSEEAQFLRAEKNVKEFSLSADLVKKESQKLLQRAALAENDMKLGYSELMDAGSKIQSLAKSVYKAENQAADLMDRLREIPGREALKLRAEVASMASLLKKQRIGLDKRIMKISEQGVPV